MGYLPEGLTLDQLADLARQKTQRKVTVLRDLDLAAFRAQLSHANDPGRRYVINFSRGPLFATGGGHHSPIAGYLSEEDLVLVLDVNKKYGPWLVKPERLYGAMNTVDTTVAVGPADLSICSCLPIHLGTRLSLDQASGEAKRLYRSLHYLEEWGARGPAVLTGLILSGRLFEFLIESRRTLRKRFDALFADDEIPAMKHMQVAIHRHGRARVQN